MAQPLADQQLGSAGRGALVYTPRELAKLLRTDTRHLAALRRDGGGPAYLQLTRSITRYLVDDVADWLASDPGRQPVDALDS